MKLVYTTAQAAHEAGVSTNFVRQAIHTTDPNAYPPPLTAHRNGQGSRAHFRIRSEDLEDWLDRIEETCPI